MPEEFRREYLLRLPLPLAQLYSRAFNAKDARSRHDNAFYLCEALVKLTAGTAAMTYLQEAERGAARKPALDRLLACLALPSLGQWVAMLRELARHFGDRPDAACHPLGGLWSQLDAQRRDLNGALALYRRLKNGPDGGPAGDQSCSLLQLLDALVQYRNGVFGHGGPRFASFYESEMGPLLFPAVNDLLAEGTLDPLGPAGSRLVYVTELRLLDDARVEVGLRDLVGVQGERTAPLTLPAAAAAALAPNHVALLRPGGAAPLRLDPLLLYREGELTEEVLFLNRDRNGRQVEYLSYTTGRTERDRSTAPALAALLSRVVSRAVGEGELAALTEQSQAETPSVEALFGPAPPTAARLGDYEVLGELGRGGMGVVYLARQLSLGRLVALKMLPGDLSGDQAALARFRREIRALGRCDHPNIVKVLASGELPDGRLYYAMEYVPGCDLEQVWRELSGSAAAGDASHLGGSSWAEAVLSASRKRREAAATRPAAPTVPLPPLPELPGGPDDPGGYVRRVAGLMRDTALALQTVHDQHLVHRDVKPANLMLTPDGLRVVLMDFGLAKGESLTSPESRAGGLLGTLRYAAPEQLAAANVTVGPAADVRGLGVTLWEMLTRRRLFADAADDEARLAQLVLTEDPPLLRRVDPSLGRDLEAIVARATERRVADRIPTARRLAEYLQLYLDGRPLPIRPPGLRERTWRWARVHKTLGGLAAAAVGVLVLILVVAGMLATRSLEVVRGVKADLAEAATLRDAAKFPEARLVIERAKERLVHGGPADLQEQVRQASADLEMVGKLEEIPFLRAEIKDNQLDWEAGDNAYRDAFAAYGVNAVALAPEEAAGRIKASAIRDQLVAALDDWRRSNKGADGALREWLLETAQRADANEGSRQLREAVKVKDVKVLRELAARPETADLAPPELVLLAEGLAQAGEGPKALAVLRETQRRHPQAFWINVYLAQYLSGKNQGPSQWEEAVGFLRAALTLRPQDAGIHGFIAQVAGQQGKLDEAEAEWRKAVELRPDFYQAHNSLGNLLRDRHKWAEAEAEYRKVIELAPGEPEGYYNLGGVLKDLGKPDEAESEYRKALERKPDLVESHVALGELLRGEGKRSEAEPELRKALELKPDSAVAHYTLGLLRDDDGKLPEAEAEYRKAIELQPDYALAHDALGCLLYDRGETAEAEAEYRKAIGLKKDYAHAHADLGILFYDHGKPAEAEAEFRKAIELKPDFPEAHRNLGLFLDKQGKPAEAEAEFRKAVAARPSFAEAYCDLGMALGKQGKSAEAETAERRAVELKPDFALAHEMLGVVLHSQGKLTAAEPEYRKAVELKPDFPEAHNHLGVVLSEQGKQSEAEAEYRRAADLKPDFPSAHYNLGVALSREGKRSEAEAEYRKAVKLKPGDADWHNTLGILLKEEGKRPEAEAEYRKALELRPGFPEAHCNLGTLLYGEGKLPEAEAEYRKAVQLKPAYPEAHVSLGILLDDRGDPAGAEAEYRKALELRSAYPEAHYDLASLLDQRGNSSEAEAEYRKAVGLRPGYAKANRGLLFLLKQQGRFADALAVARGWREATPSTDSQDKTVAAEVRACEQLIERDARLPAVLRGDDKPAAAELADFGRLCMYKRLDAAAVRLYTRAFAADAKLAESVRPSNRYNAACAAGLAGVGQGEDAAPLDDKGRAELRRQAVVWLRADLALLGERLKGDDAKAVKEARQTLGHWRRDSDLAGLRDADALAKLPEDERGACRKLWADVDALLQPGAAPVPNP